MVVEASWLDLFVQPSCVMGIIVVELWLVYAASLAPLDNFGE